MNHHDEKNIIFLHFIVDLHHTKSVGKKFLRWNTDVGRYLFNLDIQKMIILLFIIVIIMNQDYEKNRQRFCTSSWSSSNKISWREVSKMKYSFRKVSFQSLYLKSRLYLLWKRCVGMILSGSSSWSRHGECILSPNAASDLFNNRRCRTDASTCMQMCRLPGKHFKFTCALPRF